MLIAIEGPDCVGKSTLIEALRPAVSGARFVTKLPFPHTGAEKALYEATVEAWHSPSQLYISDRCMWLSDAVYSAYRGREPHPFSWRPANLRVMLLCAPPAALAERARASCHEAMDFAKLSRLYEEEVAKYEHALVDADGHRRATLLEALRVIRRWSMSLDHRD